MSPVAVASTTAERPNPLEKDAAAEHNGSGFTAVNDRDSAPNGGGERSMNGLVDRPDHRNGGDAAKGPQSARREQEPHPNPKTNGGQHYSSSRETSSPTQSHGKRKRSLTEDGPTSSASSQYDLSPPRRPSESSTAMLDPRPHRPQEPDREHGSASNGINGTDLSNARSSHGRHGQPDRPLANGVHAGPEMDASDAQLAEALEKEAQAQNSHRAWNVGGRPEDESSEQYAAYGTDPTSQGAVQAGAKRKRVFSNRTKTGCLTCRRRKKKCDELHPFCNNCKRASFECEGYSNRSTWQKQPNAKVPVPLQSKDGQAEGSEYAHSAEARSPRGKRDSVPYEGSQPIRPVVAEDGDRGSLRMSTSPASASTRNGGSYSQPWARHLSYIDSAHSNPLPPISHITRDPSKQAFSVTPYREGVRPHSTPGPHQPPSSGSWSSYPSDYPQPYPSGGSVNPRSLPGVAREGLSMEETQRSLIKGDEQQKEKMLSGQLFRFNDPMLSDDRKRCKIALRRFHDADNPLMGVSNDERQRLLLEVFVPVRNRYISLTNMSSSSASSSSTSAYAAPTDLPHHDLLGNSNNSSGGGGISRSQAISERIKPGLVVETPFRCQYGYNIRFGEDVYVGENCTIVDACAVTIGSKTWIGPNVQIISAMASTDLNKRTGSGQGANWQGSPVTIAEDVHIGPGAIIQPGVTVGRGAQINPGTVVVKNVEQYSKVGV